jgi:adenine-specific DNA-methyltransferase
MILGDSLQVMASLAEREGLRGQVQCIYFDPPYGIKFNSNFQWSTTSRDVKDGNADHITREPEQVKAFRDTWRDGIHSYLTYLRDRLTVARDLLTDSGSIFVQIGDENVHRVRAVMDEVFGEPNFISQICGQTSDFVAGVQDFILFYARNADACKFRKVMFAKPAIGSPDERYVCVEPELGVLIDLSVKQKRGDEPIPEGRILRLQDTTSQSGSETSRFQFEVHGIIATPSGKRGWSFGPDKRERLIKSGRLFTVGKSVRWKNYHDESGHSVLGNNWTDLSPSGFGEDRIYVVQTLTDFVRRCILMTTDPGDLVLDPTCGSGTTPMSPNNGAAAGSPSTPRASPWRWPAPASWAPATPTTCSPTAAKARSRKPKSPAPRPSSQPTRGNIRHGFVYERVPHITLKSIANNAEIDVIWDKWQAKLEPLREQLNQALGKHWQEWEIPPRAVMQARGRSPPNRQGGHPASAVTKEAEAKLHAEWWQARIARQKEIDASIAAKAEFEVPLRQALRGQEEGPRRRPVHRRKPVAPPRAGRR